MKTKLNAANSELLVKAEEEIEKVTAEEKKREDPANSEQILANNEVK